jgi:hypothetical protein
MMKCHSMSFRSSLIVTRRCMPILFLSSIQSVVLLHNTKHIGIGEGLVPVHGGPIYNDSCSTVLSAVCQVYHTSNSDPLATACSTQYA